MTKERIEREYNNRVVDFCQINIHHSIAKLLRDEGSDDEVVIEDKKSMISPSAVFLLSIVREKMSKSVFG